MTWYSSKVGKRTRVASIGLVALLVTLGGAAFAAIPDSSGVIHGCYDDRSGKLRVTDTEDGDPRSCGDNETPLNWNRVGPQGPTGATGPQGIAGPAGPQGPPGLSDYVRVASNAPSSGADTKSATAECPDGTRVLGGGGLIASPAGEHQIGVFTHDSFPRSAPDGWTVGARETVENGAVWGLTAYAICAAVAP